MRKTHADYRRAVRYDKRNKYDIISERFTTGLLNNSNRDFWSETKRIRRNKACFSSSVDSYTPLLLASSSSSSPSRLFVRKQ